MCGIGGVVAFGGLIEDSRATASALSSALAHRGPDGDGIFTSARALLVHRRLAIIDPSPAGRQPMAWADGRYQLVYNGEVYNFRGLRAGLEARGERFRTASDTEVLLRLLALDGPRALAGVRGMFALALWDDVAGTLLLARDRFGIKPLYVAHDSARVAFASEVGALRRAALVSRDISPAGILAYFSWAAIPAPLTWLRDVVALEPGSWCRWSSTGQMAGGRFATSTAAYVNREAAPGKEELRASASDAVRDSVRAHLVADVPVGVFLSGGIDSGAIVSAARSITEADLRTYTVAVDEASHSEGALAAAVARQFGTTHHELRVDARDIRTDLPEIIQRLDQPTADAVNSYYVSRAVAATGVKAVLSGIGGDELFGGYPSFERLPAGLQVARRLGPAMRATGAAAAVALPKWQAAKWRHFAGDPDLAAGYRALRGFFMPHEMRELLGPAFGDTFALYEARAAVEEVDRTLALAKGPELPLASVSRLETRRYLGAQLLRDIDAVSMAHGLEVRTPFVDHELQAAVWPALGHHPSLLKGKRLLYDTLARPLPAEITKRPKQGFTLPFAAWLRGELRDAMRGGMATLAAQGWIAPGMPEAVWSAFDRGQAHWSRVWGLGMLGRFLEEAP